MCHSSRQTSTDHEVPICINWRIYTSYWTRDFDTNTQRCQARNSSRGSLLTRPSHYVQKCCQGWFKQESVWKTRPVGYKANQASSSVQNASLSLQLPFTKVHFKTVFQSKTVFLKVLVFLGQKLTSPWFFTTQTQLRKSQHQVLLSSTEVKPKMSNKLLQHSLKLAFDLNKSELSHHTKDKKRSSYPICKNKDR